VLGNNQQKSSYSNQQSDIKFLFNEDKTDKVLNLIPQAKEMLELLSDLQKQLNIIADKIDILMEQYVIDNFEAEPWISQRFIGLQNSIKVKMQYTLNHWIDALKQQEKDYFTTFLELNASPDGRVYDLGVKRHYTNPMKPFADKVLRHISSVNLTSATINDKEIKDEKDWEQSLCLTGIEYLQDKNLTLYQNKSPFNYKKQAKVIIITDVDYNSKAELAKAYAKLFSANKGSSLGLFTAISRLSGVYPFLKRHLKTKSNNL
jgi:ATP-dependent DNA helicase DinG